MNISISMEKIILPELGDRRRAVAMGGNDYISALELRGLPGLYTEKQCGGIRQCHV